MDVIGGEQVVADVFEGCVPHGGANRFGLPGREFPGVTLPDFARVHDQVGGGLDLVGGLAYASLESPGHYCLPGLLEPVDLVGSVELFQF
jgi:hypothetical protein